MKRLATTLLIVALSAAATFAQRLSGNVRGNERRDAEENARIGAALEARRNIEGLKVHLKDAKSYYEEPSYPSHLRTAAPGMIYRETSGVIPIPVSETTFKLAIDLAEREATDDLILMIRTYRMFVVDNRTKVNVAGLKLLEFKGKFYPVAVVEFPDEGITGVVPQNWITQE
jgi:hypothetical protein